MQRSQPDSSMLSSSKAYEQADGGQPYLSSSGGAKPPSPSNKGHSVLVSWIPKCSYQHPPRTDTKSGSSLMEENKKLSKKLSLEAEKGHPQLDLQLGWKWWSSSPYRWVWLSGTSGWISAGSAGLGPLFSVSVTHQFLSEQSEHPQQQFRRQWLGQTIMDESVLVPPVNTSSGCELSTWPTALGFPFGHLGSTEYPGT